MSETPATAVDGRPDRDETPDEVRIERPGVPQIALVSAPQSYEETTGGTVDAAATTLTSRVLTTARPNHTYAMTCAMCLAAAARLPGTVPHAVARARTGR